MDKDLQDIKNELKEMYPNMQGFIQHTLVAEMCLKWHEKQVKNCSIPNVVNRRELLLAFCQFMHSGTYDSDNTTHNQDVDAFLESQ